MSQPIASPNPSLKPSWSNLAKIGAVAAAVGGVSLHLMGQVTHRVYLQQMGVDAGHFPKAADWLVINGYYTLADRSLTLTNAFFAHIWLMILAIFVVGGYLYGMELLGRWLKTNAAIAKPVRLPPCISDVIRNLLASALILIGIPVSVMIVMLVLLLPALMGETAGKEVAAKEMKQLMGACGSGKPDASMNCSQIVQGVKVLATGYIIDASESHVAIFDPATRRATVMELAGKTIIGKRSIPPND